MFDATLTQLATEVLEACRRGARMLATAESCTGGLIAGCLTAIPGSSDIVDRGFVTYSNDAKAELLAIAPGLIRDNGAVSERVARAMAEGALELSHADITIACTGIAGPGGGTPDKPVGRVHIASASRDGKTLHQQMDYGDIGRDAVRYATVRDALLMLKGRLT